MQKDSQSGQSLKVNAIIVMGWDYKSSFYFNEYQQLNNLSTLSRGDQQNATDQSFRFRPLSMSLPPALFPIGGYSMIFHHVKALDRLNKTAQIKV